MTPRDVAGLMASQNPLLSAVGTALHAFQGHELTGEESRWIELIEQSRKELCLSTEMLAVVDYGAGTPQDTATAEAMATGRLATETVGEACRNYSKARTWAVLLFYLIRKVGPTNCIELGACLGISAAYQATALELNGSGQLRTLEGSPSFASVATRNLLSLGLSDRASVVVGRFQDTLPGVLSAGKVDYAFIDGHHDEHATVDYFEQFLPHLADHAVLVFDDIAWSDGMRRAWRHIRDDPRVDVSIDLSSMGICLFGAGVKYRYDLSLV